MSNTIDQILRFAVQNDVSDVHFKVGHPPIYRKDGALVPHRKAVILQPIHIKEWINSIASERHQQELQECGESDFTYAISGVGRFRINAFYQRELVGLVARVIPNKIPSLEDLGLPPSITTMCNSRWGLVLVTGATGSGKSTTLSALISHINATRPVHIVTIEDPIEYLHEDQKGIVNQREVGQDTRSFSAGLRAALRQDPDVILIGEIRDIETMEIAIKAAETGHLVLSTLHTIDAPGTVSRILSMFPPHQQDEVRKTLSESLQGIISQRLLPRKNGDGRVLACEVMVSTQAVRDCIASANRISGLHDFITKGNSVYGSQTFDQSLVAHFRNGTISEETAYENASNASDMKLLLSGIS